MKKILVLAIAALFLVGSLGCTSPTSKAPVSFSKNTTTATTIALPPQVTTTPTIVPEVEYRFIGFDGATTAGVFYLTSGGVLQFRNLTLPTSISYNSFSGASCGGEITNGGNKGSVRFEIWINGKLVDSATGGVFAQTKNIKMDDYRSN